MSFQEYEQQKCKEEKIVIYFLNELIVWFMNNIKAR